MGQIFGILYSPLEQLNNCYFFTILYYSKITNFSHNVLLAIPKFDPNFPTLTINKISNDHCSFNKITPSKTLSENCNQISSFFAVILHNFFAIFVADYYLISVVVMNLMRHCMNKLLILSISDVAKKKLCLSAEKDN